MFFSRTVGNASRQVSGRSRVSDFRATLCDPSESPLASACGPDRRTAMHVSPTGRPTPSGRRYTPEWDLHQLRHTAISVRAAHGYTEIDLKRFSGHTSLRSLERYIADNREAAKRKARAWERRQGQIRGRLC